MVAPMWLVTPSQRQKEQLTDIKKSSAHLKHASQRRIVVFFFFSTCSSCPLLVASSPLCGYPPVSPSSSAAAAAMSHPRISVIPARRSLVEDQSTRPFFFSFPLPPTPLPRFTAYQPLFVLLVARSSRISTHSSFSGRSLCMYTHTGALEFHRPSHA